MDNVEATDTNFGKYVPMHLLKFEGDPELQASFRLLLETNYGKGIVKQDSGVCQACGAQISTTCGLKMKPSQAKSKRIMRLLGRHKAGSLFGKYNNYVLQRYLRSFTRMTVRCLTCQHLNKQRLISNEMKDAIKDKLLQNALTASTEVATPPLSASQKKKRRKKKKNKVDEQDSCGLKLSDRWKDSPTVSYSVQQDLSTPPLQVKTTSQGAYSTSNQDKNKFRSSNSKKNSAASLNPRYYQTPQGSWQRKTATSAVLLSNARKSGIKQKNLKQFLAEDQTETKSASLADFLSSL